MSLYSTDPWQANHRQTNQFLVKGGGTDSAASHSPIRTAMSFASKGQLSLEKVKAGNYKSHISFKDQCFLRGFKAHPTWCYICHRNIWSSHFKSNTSRYDRWHSVVKKKKPGLSCWLTERVAVDKTKVYSNQLKCILLCIVSAEHIKSQLWYRSANASLLLHSRCSAQLTIPASAKSELKYVNTSPHESFIKRELDTIVTYFSLAAVI